MKTSVEDRFVQFARTGDPDPLADVFDRTAPSLLRAAMHLVRDTAQAEDVLQATYLTAIEKASSYDASRPLLPWLQGILVRHVRRAKERAARGANTPSQDLASRLSKADDPADPADVAAQKETAEVLRSHIEGMKEVYRQVLLLRLHHGLEPVEIAEVLRLAPGTVRMRLHRGMRILRGLLPAGVGLSLLAQAAPGQGLAGVRDSVLRHAASHAPAVVLGGALLMKKLIPAVIGVLTLLAVWTIWPGRSETGDSDIGQRTLIDQAATAADPSIRGQDAESGRQRLGEDAAPSAAVERSAGLRIRVVDPDGESVPMVGITVTPHDGRDPVVQTRGFVTDARGVAVAEDLPVGQVKVALDRMQHRVVLLRPDKLVEETFVLTRGVTVLGRVVGVDGQAIPFADIWVRENTARSLSSKVGQCDADGSFRLRCLTPRINYVGAGAPGLAPSSLHPVVDPSTFDSGAAVVPQQMRIVLREAAAKVRGLVLGMDDEPVAGAMVRIGGRSGGLSIMVRPDRMHMGWAPVRVKSATDGTFFVEGLPSGQIEFLVHGPGYAPYTQHFELSPGRTSDVTIRLIEGAALRGRVLDESGAPIGGAHVTVGAFGYVLETSTETTASGWFDLRGLDSRRIKLLVQVDGLTPFAEEYTAAPGETLDVEVSLRRGRVLRGRIVDEESRPLGGWFVSGTGVRMVSADESGRFRIDVGVRRALRLQVSPPRPRRFVECDWLGEVTAEGDTEIEVRVPDRWLPVARISGMLMGPDGKPARAIRFSLVRGGQEVQVVSIKQETGAFALGPVAAGDYELRWECEDAEGRSFGRRALAGVSRDLDLGAVPAYGPGVERAGYVRAKVRRKDGVPIESTGLHLFDGRGREIAGVRLVDGEGRRALPAGTYEYSVMSNNAQWRRGRFVITPERETVVSLELPAATRRYILLPWPLPSRWENVSWMRYTIEDGNGEVLDADQVGRNDLPLMYMPGLRVGEHRVRCETSDGRHFAGSFSVDSLLRSNRPILIAVRPDRTAARRR